jgi:dihydroneopterin aldolase
VSDDALFPAEESGVSDDALGPAEESGVSDTIRLTGLRAPGHHGVYEAERAEGQEFVVDVILQVDLSAAAASDDIADTVHYGDLADALVTVVTGEPVQLIETLAARLAGVCLADDRVTEATVTVHKPQAPIEHPFADVSVTLTRTRPAAPAGPTPAGPTPMRRS